MRYVPTPPAAPAPAPMPVLSGQPDRSTWHSPVPYLFGGLAAMLGLISFALLILACSYWRISGLLDPPPPAADDDGGVGGVAKPVGPTEPVPYSEGSFVVVMAGDRRPTFLATPAASRASSFGADDGGNVTGNVAAVAGEQQL